MRVLVVNVGSSSLKLSLLDGEDRALAEQELAAPRAQIDEPALRSALTGPLGQADAVGHRIVHGGERYTRPVRIDAEVEDQLRGLTDLAPLHQPRSLAALDGVSRVLTNLPAVACFDTAFHATLAPAAFTYALPAAWRERWGIRRYGFHGLSHAWVARRAAELIGRPAERLRIVSCHLGAGASLCAIRGGQSVDTTMGFTPLEGLVMATRSGSVDPGLLLWLLEREAMSESELAATLEHESGLLGLAGTTDMRDVLERASRDETAARVARDVYVHRLRGAIAAMAAALAGLDVLVFTGGVGEHSPAVRGLAAEGLGFLGVELDSASNRAAVPDTDISASRSTVRTLVIAAREDIAIARQVRGVLSGSPPPPAASRP